MEEPSSQLQPQRLDSQSIKQIFAQEKPQLRNGFDGVILVLHAVMKNLGFTLISCGDSGLGDSGNVGAFAPEGWNGSSDSYSFKYKHPRGSKTFVIRNLVMGETLLVNGLAGEEKNIHTFDLILSDYIQEGVALDDYDHLFKNLDRLISNFLNNIVYKMAPDMGGTRTQAPTRERPTYDPYNDPLRVPNSGRQPGRSPLMEGGPFNPQPFGIGNRDMNPFGFTTPGQEGNLMGPGHPGFGPQVTDPYGAGHPFGGRPPPGARYDPFGPPRRGNPFGEPDNDDVPPPGGANYDMFL